MVYATQTRLDAFDAPFQVRCPVEAALLADPIRHLDPLLGILKRMLAQGADRAHLPFRELAHHAGTQPGRPREHEYIVFISSVFVRQAQPQNAADACRRFSAGRFHGLLFRGGSWAARTEHRALHP